MRILSFIFLFSFASILSAQISRPHFISVNFGTNIPLNEYDEADSIIGASANTGLYYSFEAGAYFSKVFGIALNIGAFNNSVDEKGIEEQLKEEFTQNDQFSVNSNDWVNGYIMLGPVLSFGSEKFIADVKLLGGIMNSAKPFVNIQADGNGGSAAVSQSSEVTSSALGLNYGLHFRIKLIGKLGLRINAEGFMSNHDFETKVSEPDPNGGVTISTNETVEKRIEALNLGAGLVLTL